VVGAEARVEQHVQVPEDEVACARRLVAAFEAAVVKGKGLLVFEGRAIDLPVAEAERAILARARDFGSSGALSSSSAGRGARPGSS